MEKGNIVKCTNKRCCYLPAKIKSYEVVEVLSKDQIELKAVPDNGQVWYGCKRCLKVMKGGK